MTSDEKSVYVLHAETCKTLAHPKRIEIIDLLRDGEMLAGDLAGEMGVSKANLSQHLSILRSNGIVETRRLGPRIYYRIANPKVVEACQLMRQVLLERLAQGSELARLVKERGE